MSTGGFDERDVSPCILKHNLCYDVIRNFGTTYCVTL